MKLTTTFALSMLETWEIVLICECDGFLFFFLFLLLLFRSFVFVEGFAGWTPLFFPFVSFFVFVFLCCVVADVPITPTDISYIFVS